jgi:flagellar biosynthesis GTPase FlhF
MLAESRNEEEFMRLRMQVLTGSLAMVAAAAGVLAAQSGLSNLSLIINDLKPQIVASLRDGFLPSYSNRNAYKAAPPAARVAFVNQALNWLKTYTNSAEFKADYAKQRAEARPERPESKGTPADQYAKQQADQRKGIEDMKKAAASMPPDQQKQMNETIKQMEAMLEQNAKNPEMEKAVKAAYEQDAQSDEERYKKDIADYENRFPADPKVLIASRLREFLDQTRDIDFNARLQPAGGGMMRFADEQYESKGERWKQCYRAGKEPCEAARSFAAEWLKQLEAK